MPLSEEVFISYSHDSVDHVQRVLALSDRLRADGIDCVLDQYEVSPPEGWPRWMDRKIRDCKYVILICTEPYYRRVMGEEVIGKGLGVRWEGNLIYQHFYNAGTSNQRFIPVVLAHEQWSFVPTPLQGATYYSLDDETGYDDLYKRMTGQAKAQKPKLGTPQPKRPVKTNPALFLTTPIDLELWDAAKWQATFFGGMERHPPILGLGFTNEKAARKIFEGWHERYGDRDRLDELRISVVEGPIAGLGDGYSVHIGSDLDAAVKRFKEVGYEFDSELFMSISRFQRMNPPAGSGNLAMFKKEYDRYKTYVLAPGIVSQDRRQVEPMYDLGIYKRKILFRQSFEIGDNDLDTVILQKDEHRAR